MELGAKELRVGALNTNTTFSGSISGTSGAFTKVGGGVLTLSGANSYASTTTISAGTLQIGDGGTSGSISGNIVDNAALIFNRTGTLTNSGDISGTGSLTKLASGTVILAGDATHTGGTTISEGTLAIGDGGTLGSISGNITDNATLIFDRSNAITFANSITGTGTVTKAGDGLLTLTGTNNYSGSTTLSEGALQIGNGGTTGSVSGNIAILGAHDLIFNRSNSYTYSDVISGDDRGNTVVKEGSGTLILTGNNTYAGSTMIAAGTLQIGNDGTSRMIAGDITDNTALIFNRSDSFSFDDNISISGSGTLTKQGAGTLTLTRNNTLTGDITISAGTLQIGDGGFLGSLPGNIIDNSALIFNRRGLLTYDNVISGSGTVTQNGSGEVTLNGANTYTGVTTINAERLVVGDANHTTASIAGDVIINGEDMLEGYGNVDGNITNNGHAAPGGSIGTLNVIGNYTQSPDGIYEVEVNSAGNSDLLNVMGTAALNGTLAVNTQLGFSANTPYTIITADNGVSGTFSNASQGEFHQGFLKGTVKYLSNEVNLTLSLDSGAILNNVVLARDKEMARYILSVSTDQIPGSITGSLEHITTAAELQLLLHQMSTPNSANQITGLTKAAYGSGFEDELADRFSLFPNCKNNDFSMRKVSLGNRYEYCNEDKTIWIVGEGASDQLSTADGGSLNNSHQGMAVGFEDPLDDQKALGGALGVSHFDNTATSGDLANAEGELFQFGLYGRYQKSRWLFGASLDGGATDTVHATRAISLLSMTIPYNYSGTVFAEQARISYDLWHEIIRAFIGIFNQNANRNRYTEQGSSGFELAVNSSSDHSLRSQVGMMFDIPTHYMVRPFASVAWEHEFLDDSSSFDAQLIAVGGSSYFHIEGDHTGQDIAALKAGLGILQYRRFNLYGLYAGQFAQRWHENGGRVVAEVHF